MSTIALDQEVRTYLDAVAAHLSDVPAQDLHDLLEDLEAHLREVRAEEDGPLEERLGPPARFAEELRASAGLARTESSVGPVGRARAAAARLGERPAVAALRGWMRQQRPAWHALRGYLAVVLLQGALGESHNDRNVLIPEISGSPLLGIGMVALAVWASVRLGSSATRRRWVNGMFTVMGIAGAIVLLARGSVSAVGSYDAYVVPQYLSHFDGETITDICPYGSDGRALRGVLLFDQDGRAISNVADPWEQSTYSPEHVEPPAPMVPNRFPRNRAVDPETGEPVKSSCPKLVITTDATGSAEDKAPARSKSKGDD